MAAVVLCQLLWALLLLCVTQGRPSTAMEAVEVQEPFNLTVYSYNLYTTLHWDYNKMHIPYFYVFIWNKLKMNWGIIETCQNISHHYCDLSYNITDPLEYYKVGVTAFVDSKMSSITNTEFRLSSVGILGPPELKVHKDDKKIVVDVFHPKVPFSDEIKSILDHGELDYVVFCGNHSEQTSDCDDFSCTVIFPYLDEGIYCCYAQGTSDYFVGMTMEKSKENCINVSEHYGGQTIGIIMGVTFGFLAILAISCFIITRWTKARALMPHSLSSIVRNMASYVYMPTPQTLYGNVSTSPIESPVEEITSKVDKMNMDTDVSTGSNSKANTDLGYQSSLTENEQRTDERGDDPSNSSSYFHTDGSTSGTNSRDTPESEKEEQTNEHAPEPPKIIKPLTNSFGYDKPHFPKELI